MTAIQLLACAGMIVGAFLILGLKPVEFTDSLFAFLLWKKSSIREDGQFFHGSGSGGGVYVPALLVCEADCQPL